MFSYLNPHPRLIYVQCHTPRRCTEASETLCAVSVLPERHTALSPPYHNEGKTSSQKDVRYFPPSLVIFCAGHLSSRKDRIKPILRNIKWFRASSSQNRDQYSHVFSTVFSHKYLCSKKEIILLSVNSPCGQYEPYGSSPKGPAGLRHVEQPGFHGGGGPRPRRCITIEALYSDKGNLKEDMNTRNTNDRGAFFLLKYKSSPLAIHLIAYTLLFFPFSATKK